MQNGFLEQLKVKKTPKSQERVGINIPITKINVDINTRIKNNTKNSTIDRMEFLKKIKAQRRNIDKRNRVTPEVKPDAEPDATTPTQMYPDDIVNDDSVPVPIALLSFAPVSATLPAFMPKQTVVTCVNCRHEQDTALHLTTTCLQCTNNLYSLAATQPYPDTSPATDAAPSDAPHPAGSPASSPRASQDNYPSIPDAQDDGVKVESVKDEDSADDDELTSMIPSVSQRCYCQLQAVSRLLSTIGPPPSSLPTMITLYMKNTNARFQSIA